MLFACNRKSFCSRFSINNFYTFCLLYSNEFVTLTLWNADAVEFIDSGYPVLLVKGARISEFEGVKSITICGLNQIERNPELLKARYLRDWFNNAGGRNVRRTIATPAAMGSDEWLTFREAKIKNLGNGDKPDYYHLKGIITLIRDTNMTYKACAQDNCLKKVIQMPNGQYRCEKCNIESGNFKYRMIVGVSVFPDLCLSFLESNHTEKYTNAYLHFHRCVFLIGHQVVGLPCLVMKLRKFSVCFVTFIINLDNHIHG